MPKSEQGTKLGNLYLHVWTRWPSTAMPLLSNNDRAQSQFQEVTGLKQPQAAKGQKRQKGAVIRCWRNVPREGGYGAAPSTPAHAARPCRPYDPRPRKCRPWMRPSRGLPPLTPRPVPRWEPAVPPGGGCKGLPPLRSRPKGLASLVTLPSRDRAVPDPCLTKGVPPSTSLPKEMPSLDAAI